MLIRICNHKSHLKLSNNLLILYTLQIPEVHHHLHPYDHCRLSGHRPASQLPGKPNSQISFFSKSRLMITGTLFLLLGRASEASMRKEPWQDFDVWPSSMIHPQPELRIRDILVRLRLRGSVPLTNGSGSDSGSYFFHQCTGTLLPYFLNVWLHTTYNPVHLHHFPKIKCHKEVTKNIRIQIRNTAPSRFLHELDAYF
jgi:hypothetical protein